MTAPAHLWVPPHVASDGDLAERMGVEQLGFDPDPGQRLFLDAVFAVNEDGLPACFEVAVVAPRQNLKTAALQEAACTWLFAEGRELIIWTAHLYDTAQKAFESMKQRIDRCPDLKAQCKWPPPSAHGAEAIVLKTGEAIEFHARSTGGGRGLTGDKVVFDEAYALKPNEVSAVLPTMATTIKDGGQVIYASSAGLLQSEVLRGVRDRGRAGGDPQLGYLEWCAPWEPCEDDRCTHVYGVEGCALDRRHLWVAANPAVAAGRITEDAIEKFRKAMAIMPHEFAREFLGWWDDPPNLGGAFDMDVWAALADPTAEQGTQAAFGVAVAPDRSWAAIAVAWTRPDGLTQVGLTGSPDGGLDYRPTTTWVKDRVAALEARWGVKAVAHEDAIDLLPDPDPEQKLSGPEQRRAHHGLDDSITARTVRHDNQPALNVAVRAAQWRKQGDSRVLDRSGSVDISPLHAVALARHALATVNEKVVSLW